MSLTLDGIYSRCEEVGECLHWTGAFSHQGKGWPRVWDDGSYRMVRRLVAVLDKGRPIGRGLSPSMNCRDPKCVRAEHIALRTASQIQKLAASEGKFSTPQRIAAITVAQRKRSKLGADDVAEIRASTLSAPELADKLGIHRSLVCRIRRGDSWRPLPNSSVWSMT